MRLRLVRTALKKGESCSRFRREETPAGATRRLKVEEEKLSSNEKKVLEELRMTLFIRVVLCLCETPEEEEQILREIQEIIKTESRDFVVRYLLRLKQRFASAIYWRRLRSR